MIWLANPEAPDTLILHTSQPIYLPGNEGIRPIPKGAGRWKNQKDWSAFRKFENCYAEAQPRGE